MGLIVKLSTNNTWFIFKFWFLLFIFFLFVCVHISFKCRSRKMFYTLVLTICLMSWENLNHQIKWNRDHMLLCTFNVGLLLWCKLAQSHKKTWNSHEKGNLFFHFFTLYGFLCQWEQTYTGILANWVLFYVFYPMQSA